MVEEKKVNEKIISEAPENPRLDLNPELKQVYMTGATGGFTPHDFRLLIFTEKPEESDDPDSLIMVRDIHHEIIMSHLSVKELYIWLGKSIKQVEDQVGEIKPLKKKPTKEDGD